MRFLSLSTNHHQSRASMTSWSIFYARTRQDLIIIMMPYCRIVPGSTDSLVLFPAPINLLLNSIFLLPFTTNYSCYLHDRHCEGLCPSYWLLYLQFRGCVPCSYSACPSLVRCFWWMDFFLRTRAYCGRTYFEGGCLWTK